jgi:8-oxo-dGTP pyrophosphatase MutT (NUDIX family)
MSEVGVVVIVLHQNRVLLTKREDFEVWCLPGGGIESHESVDQSAIREVFEETGIAIVLTHHVGLLSKPHWGNGTLLSVFAARPTTTTLCADPREVQAVAFFPLDDLPTPLIWDHQHLIRAACSGTTGHVWLNRAQTPPHFANRAELYQWRDQSGLERQAAYYRLIEEIGRQTFEAILGPQDIEA